MTMSAQFSRATYSVCADLSSGAKLGITYEPASLEISSIKPEGLVALWNASHPEAIVRPGDRILEVNGKSFEKLGAAAVQAEISNSQMLSISFARTLNWHMRLDTRSGRLGLRLDPDSLQVRAIDEQGMVAKWNSSRPSFAVRVGDRIKEVNGVRAADGAAGVHSELRGEKVLDVTLARDVTSAEEALFFAQQQTASVMKGESGGEATNQTSAATAPPTANTFVVLVDATNVGKLGLNIEPGTLAVNSVKDTGLIAAWNHANPESQVHPNDQIVAVNGRHITTDGADALQEMIRTQQTLKLIVARAPTFSIRIDKRGGGKLGCAMDMDTLEIKAISGAGLVAAWNMFSPDLAVQPGDRLVEVNGKNATAHGVGNVNAEITAGDILNMKLVRGTCRGPGGAAATGTVAPVLPTLPVSPTPTTFSLLVDRSQEQKLGLSFEMGTLSVNSVSPSGLVAAWNSAHPDRSVQPNDQIVAVNGKHISTHGAAMLHETLKGDRSLEITIARAYFVIRLDKQPGQKIGAIFYEDTLNIKMIEFVGLLADWNRAHPDAAVRPGDRVIEVNGKQTSQQTAAELSAEMRQEQVLRIGLAREPAAAGLTPSTDQSTFQVELDKANGNKLGLVFEVGTLKIDAVQENGLVPLWNRANPDFAVRPSDQIVEVNGRHLTTHGPEQLQNTIYKELILKITIARASTYVVLLQKPGDQKVGLKFDPDKLRVSSVDSGGLAAAWNMQCPERAIQPGDCITEVNNHNVCDHGATQVSEELRSSKLLRIVMARRVAVPPPGSPM